MTQGQMRLPSDLGMLRAVIAPLGYRNIAALAQTEDRLKAIARALILMATGIAMPAARMAAIQAFIVFAAHD